MIKHIEDLSKYKMGYPSGSFFIRRRYNVNGLYLYAEGACGPCISIYKRKNGKYPWKVYVGPFLQKGQKDERSFKNFKNAVKLFRSLGRQFLQDQ